MSVEKSLKVIKAKPGEVNIYRDKYGNPHIYAEMEEDGYWGLGYSMAEDRLKGVLLYYLSLKGELAKHFGSGQVKTSNIDPWFNENYYGDIPDTVASDKTMLQRRHLQDSIINFQNLDPQLQRNMTAYIEGVKQYMKDHPEEVPDWAPSLRPELPLAASNTITLTVFGNVCEVAITNYNPGNSGLNGSNGWAFPADRMVEKSAVFMSDSHGPTLWPYGTFLVPARINAGSIDAWMLDVPGMVLPIKGHTRNFAWGWTEGPRQPADCIVVETEKNDPSSYLYDGKLVRMSIQPFEIEVNGEESIKGVFEYTHHNGVLSPVVKRVGKKAFAVSHVYMQRAGFNHQTTREILLAKNEEDMRAALSKREIYEANLLYAGKDGSIDYIRPGRIPIRPEGFKKNLPVDGNYSEGAWLGIHPLEDLVQVKNPKQRYLVNNNVSPETMFKDPYFKSENYPEYFSFDGLIGTRQKRSIELFEGKSQFSFDDTLKFVMDDFGYGTDKWGPQILKYSETNPELVDKDDVDLKKFIQTLSKFDGYFSAASKGALYLALVIERVFDKNQNLGENIFSSLSQNNKLTQDQQKILITYVLGAYKEVQTSLGGLDKTFGDIYRIGRGGVSEPSHGFSKENLITLWSTSYSEPDENGFRWAWRGSRHPFLVQFTQPIKSYSLAVFGASDNINSPHFSDQSSGVVGEGLHTNYFEPSELEKETISKKTHYTKKEN
ncbi:MAG: penicillin acylase family protein [Sphingomonadales bacterium]